jgi:hypothetical protein
VAAGEVPGSTVANPPNAGAVSPTSRRAAAASSQCAGESTVLVLVSGAVNEDNTDVSVLGALALSVTAEARNVVAAAAACPVDDRVKTAGVSFAASAPADAVFDLPTEPVGVELAEDELSSDDGSAAAIGVGLLSNATPSPSATVAAAARVVSIAELRRITLPWLNFPTWGSTPECSSPRDLRDVSGFWCPLRVGDRPPAANPPSTRAAAADFREVRACL